MENITKEKITEMLKCKGLTDEDLKKNGFADLSEAELTKKINEWMDSTAEHAKPGKPASAGLPDDHALHDYVLEKVAGGSEANYRCPVCGSAFIIFVPDPSGMIVFPICPTCLFGL